MFVPDEPVGVAIAGTNQAAKRQRWIADPIGGVEGRADIGDGRKKLEEFRRYLRHMVDFGKRVSPTRTGCLALPRRRASLRTTS
jgi:hypothetical protein